MILQDNGAGTMAHLFRKSNVLCGAINLGVILDNDAIVEYSDCTFADQ